VLRKLNKVWRTMYSMLSKMEKMAYYGMYLKKWYRVEIMYKYST